MTIRTYEPKVSVKLIKAVRRKEIVESMPAISERYAQFNGVDLTPWFGESGGVRVVKGIREPAGGFSITLADKKHPEFLESLYALIEPMDMVEIRFAHDPYEYAKPKDGYELPVVMRGFVSSVNRAETMGGDGRPVRSIQIAGQDYGKILQILQIFYLNNSVVGDNVLTGFKLFEKFGLEAKEMAAKEFVETLVSKVINPYMQDLTALTRADLVDASIVDFFKTEVSIEGTVNPIGVQRFDGGSVWQLLAAFCDVGPFNELYVEDRAKDVAIVLRPNPFERPDRSVIQDGVKADQVSVPAEMIQSITSARSDAGVANYYWCGNTSWNILHNGTMKMLAQTGQEADFLLFDYPNSSKTYYGLRKMEVESRLGDPALLNGDGPKAETLENQQKVFATWLDKRRHILAETNKDNVVFENGTIRMYGSERVKPGHYMEVRRGAFRPRYYITRVEHDFVPYRGYWTTAYYERGTGFIDRAGLPKGRVAYSNEIDGDGVFGPVERINV